MLASSPIGYTYPPFQAPAWGTMPAAPMPQPLGAPSAMYGPMGLVGGTIRAKDPEIRAALNLLGQIENLPQDEAYLQSIGINIIFRNGREALDLIQRRGARVEFGDIGDNTAHAAWVAEENKMIINQNYRGNMSLPVLYAIAESIYHEAGHAARLGDNQSSIQEELDCLALNTMAYRFHCATDSRYPRATSQGPLRQLFENGVALYPKLFFDPDPYKRRLVSRVIEKYGMLPPDTPDHPIPHLNGTKAIAERVVHEIHRRNTMAMWGQQINVQSPQAQAALK